MVMAQSLFKILRRRHPQRRIGVLAPPATLPLLAFMPEIAATVALSAAHGALALAKRRAAARGLRAAGYGWAIVLPRSWKSALVPFWAGIARRTGYLGEARWGLLNDIRRLGAAASRRTMARFVALALSPDEAVEMPAPQLVLPQAAAAESLAALGLAAPDAPVLVLCPGADYGPAKRWPVEHFAALARDRARAGWVVWILGSPRDAAAGLQIAEAAGGRIVDLTGRTSLAQAVALLSLAETVVANDSGLAHVAAALGRRTIVLFGASDPQATAPQSDKATVLWQGLPCSPCHRRRCPLGHHACLRGLRPEAVIPLVGAS